MLTLTGEGEIITRGYEEAYETKMDELHLVQTNIDSWETDEQASNNNILWSIERRATVTNWFSDKKQQDVDLNKLLKLFDASPIKNAESIYKTAMIPRKKFIKTWVY